MYSRLAHLSNFAETLQGLVPIVDPENLSLSRVVLHRLDTPDAPGVEMNLHCVLRWLIHWQPQNGVVLAEQQVGFRCWRNKLRSIKTLMKTTKTTSEIATQHLEWMNNMPNDMQNKNIGLQQKMRKITLVVINLYKWVRRPAESNGWGKCTHVTEGKSTGRLSLFGTYLHIHEVCQHLWHRTGTDGMKGMQRRHNPCWCRSGNILRCPSGTHPVFLLQSRASKVVMKF